MKNTFKSRLLMAVALLLFACDKETEILNEKEQVAIDDVHFVSKQIAMNLASDIAYDVIENEITSTGKNPSSITVKKKTKNVKEVPDEKGLTAYYIINYQEGGFVIVAADKRSEAILAFSETDEFQMDAKFYPTGLVDWLETTSDQITDLRESKKDDELAFASSWEINEIQGVVALNSSSSATAKNFQATDGCYYPGQIGCPAPCQDTYYSKGPLLSTAWGQGVGYNNTSPVTGCSNYTNGHAPTGCVATATSQIMRYHQKPSTYNWSIMPNNSGSNETSRLMRNVGSAVGMSYSCNGSGADTEKVVNALKNNFGYSSASYANYDHNVVKQQIALNQPVILRGGREKSWWIFKTYADGHAWVCDGYRTSYHCSSGMGYAFAHMNWGWGDNSNNFNGWYAFNNWNPGSNTFNYKTKMVYNIKK